MENHFVRDPSQYSRDLNVIKHYMHDAATYLSIRTGKPYDVCHKYVKEKAAPGGEMGMQDTPCLVLTKHKPGQREKEVIPFSDYLRDIIENDRTISPSGVAYVNADQKKSVLSDFIGVNIERRGQSKDEMFLAKQEGDKEREEYKKNEQKSFKISNNSLSGTHASTSTILYNKSAHSSLTSTCRIATSYGNACTEKFLYGNRHYWCPDIAKANLISVINSTDYPALERTMKHFDIHYPTAQETLECIKYSTDLYWRNHKELEDIAVTCEKLTPLQRAAFVYSGDIHHLALLNDHLVRNFIEKLSTKVEEPCEDPDQYIQAMDADLEAFVGLMCEKELVGKTIKEVKEESPRDYGVVAANVANILNVLDEYKLIITSLWCVDTLPASVAHIRSSVRRGVVTSDTDSTIFTVQDWTRWFVGKIDFSEKSKQVSYAMVYLATQVIAHALAQTSAGMGVRERDLSILSMKNEFMFPVFVLTSMAKHYFAYISAQEGNVYQNYDTEVKGVYLKDSTCPPHVMKDFKETLMWTMDQVINKNEVSVVEVMEHLAGIENQIKESVYKGDTFYLKSTQVKDPSAYANPLVSPHVHYTLWEAVFAPKYGHAPEPPYAAISVSVNLKNKTQINEWLEQVADPGIKDRMMKWMKEYNKKGMTTILLPKPVIEVTGLPEEIIKAMSLRKLVFGIVKQYYFLLESLGVYMINDNLTRLVSDTFKK